MSKKPRELNPEALFYLALKRWDVVLAVPVLTVLVAGLVWQIMPHRYQSTARLLIQDQQTVNPFLKDMLEEWSAKQRMPLVESIFQSHSTSERVLRKLGHLDDAATPGEVNEAVEDFQRQFEVIGLGGELVLIKVQGQTPAEAYDATTALVDTFTDQILRPQRETVRASAEFFGDQLEQLRGDRAAMQMQVGQASVAKRESLDGHMSIRRALAEAEVRLASAEQEVELSEERLKKKPSGRYLRKQLAEARRELYELKYLYGRNHPQLVALETRVRVLRNAVRRDREEAEASSRVTNGGEDKADATPDEATKHQALMLELSKSRAEVELLRQLLVTEELSMFEEANQVWTVEAPVMPTRSLKPPLWVVLPAALFAGLILALLVLAFFAATDDSIRGEQELSEALGEPSLGRMPQGEA